MSICNVKQRINYSHLFKYNKNTIYIKQNVYNLKINNSKKYQRARI